MVFRNPRTIISALARLETLQLRALGFLNTVDPWTQRLTIMYMYKVLFPPQWYLIQAPTKVVQYYYSVRPIVTTWSMWLH